MGKRKTRKSDPNPTPLKKTKNGTDGQNADQPKKRQGEYSLFTFLFLINLFSFFLLELIFQRGPKTKMLQNRS